jgi:hypothetical protein
MSTIKRAAWGRIPGGDTATTNAAPLIIRAGARNNKYSNLTGVQ